MKAGFMCGLKKLKRKKIPSLLLGICILITTALLVNAFVFIKKLNSVFDSAYEKMEGAHLCCLWSNEMFSADFVKEYLDNSQEGFEYQVTEKTKTIDYMEKDGIRLSNGIVLELPETIESDMLSPKLPVDSKPDMPGKREVWITKKLANILHLSEGDEFSLRFADQSVKVKAVKIVTDTVFGSSGTNIYRMWCGYGELSDFPTAENNAVSYLELRFDTYSSLAEQNFIRETEEYFHMPLGNALYTYDKIKNGYMAVYEMVGAVLCFVSLVLVVTIAALTVFLVKSDMEEDVKNIGIYKSLGMTGTQIICIYLVSYGIISFFGAALGSVAGGFFSKRIILGVLENIGIITTVFMGIAGHQLFVWLLVNFVVLLICFFSIIKIQGLNASYAIKKGEWQPRKKGRRKSYDNGLVSFELYYAARGMRKRKLRYGYIAGVCLVFSSLAIVCMGCLNAVKNIDKEPEAWGFIKTDIYVSSLKNTPVSTVVEELEKDPRIDYTYGVNKVYATYRPENQSEYQSITTELYELPWNKKIKDRSLYGSRPEKENQIGVGLGLAEEYGFEVGDKIELSVNGKVGEYKVTEIFQTLSNSGKVFRMVTDDLDEFVKADNHYGDYMLVLKDSSEKWDYAEELAEKYNGEFSFIASKSNGENFTGVLAPAIGFILAILIFIIVLITMNLTFLLIKREQNRIGLLKAVGMTSWQVLKIYLCRNCISAIAGGGLGTLVGVYIIPNILNPYAKLLGLTKFPFAPSVSGILMGLILPSFCMFLGTWAVMKTIRRVSIKQLVNE
ncbi:MAG: ABC transporter permease [Roseburia sp.]|nr:ABC transporter permease [Roseburia sp.]